jgi:hypothetical protein
VGVVGTVRREARLDRFRARERIARRVHCS